MQGVSGAYDGGSSSEQRLTQLGAGRAGQVVCLCGTGNNGGDGLAAMRILMEENPAFRGECWLLPGRLSADAQRELDRLTEAAGSPPHVAVHRVEGDFAMPEKVACAIDAPICPREAMYARSLFVKKRRRKASPRFSSRSMRPTSHRSMPRPLMRPGPWRPR